MNDYGLVSIVTASYNMGQFLPTAINSVLDQTYRNVEINVVDDGSTDNTSEIMKQFSDDDRVHYFYQENQRQARAKNRGIRESQGKFIAFLDADDKWAPTKLEKQLQLFEKNPNVGVVYTDVAYMDENGKMMTCKSNKTYYRGRITEQLFKDNFINFPSAVVLRKCLDDVGLFDASLLMSIDWDLWLRISTLYDFEYVDEPLFIYRQWPGQMSHNFEKRFECIVDIMERFVVQHGYLLSAKTIREAWAHTYLERAWKARALEKDRLKALKFVFISIKNSPGYLASWKEFVKIAFL